MVQTVSRSVFSRLADVLLSTTQIRKATKFVSPTLTVSAAHRFKPTKRCSRNEILFTVGRPNYDSSRRIRTLKRAGEPFPVKKLRLEWYPKKGS